MRVLETAVDPHSASQLAARDHMLAALAELATALDAARESGGEKAVTRHHARGRLLARERIELLVDRDSPLLELSPVAGWGTGAPVGAGVVTGLGVVEDRVCVLVATEPTVNGGVVGAAGLRKIQRAVRIAQENRLPMVQLLEITGVEPAERSETFGRIGALAASLAGLTAAGVPTVGVCFGEHRELDGVDLAEWFEQLVTLSRSVTSPAVTNPAASGPATSGRFDQLVDDERAAIRLSRHCLRRLPGPRSAETDQQPVCAPRHDVEDLLAVPVTEPREILGRILDGSKFDEIEPGNGHRLCTGWGVLHGHRLAVVANRAGPAGPEEAGKAVRLIERAANSGAPVLLLQHSDEPTGASTEPAVSAAVARTGVPVMSIQVGQWRGVSAVSALARFRFAWPTAGASAGGAGAALARSGLLIDDGVIDPRDTRTVVGLCLGVNHYGQL